MITNSDRADALASVCSQLQEAICEAREILQGTDDIGRRARSWLEHLDRATGIEQTTTIEDTIEELRRSDHEE